LSHALGSVVVKRSNRLILLGLIIAISAALLAAAYVSSAGGGGGGGEAAELASPTPTPEPRVQVVAAAVAIPAGTTIKAEMLKLKEMTLSERNALGADTFSRKDDVVGKIAGSNISADQVLVASKDFYAPGSVMEGKSLKDSISAGMVGISMEVDQVNGVGTLLVPGDHVDIILTVYVEQLSISVKNTDLGVTIPLGGSQVTSKLIFENCRILATLLPPAEENAKATPVPAPGATGPAITAAPSSPIVQNTGRHMIVIVEVWPDQATVIRWAQRAEKSDPQNYIDLALILRSSKDDGADIGTKSKVGGVTFAVLVAEYGVLPPDPTKTLPKALGDRIRW
jgi:Flp pilus assembly protein CpaB